MAQEFNSLKALGFLLLFLGWKGIAVVLFFLFFFFLNRYDS